MKPTVMFDMMGAQVQVQAQTGRRLLTWTRKLKELYSVRVTNYRELISKQLQDCQAAVLITTTHQYTSVPKGSTPPPILPNPIPQNWNFTYSQAELQGLQSWIYQGGGLLLFVNHSAFKKTDKPLPTEGPYWPLNDIQLAAALGITTVFATINLTGSDGKAFPMRPGPDAPHEIVQGVSAVEAWDSGGIAPNSSVMLRQGASSTVLVPLSTDGKDESGLDYDISKLAFAVLYPFGKGNIIVVGHSGICGDANTDWPSPGQIESKDNLQFLMNCVAYLISARR
jgi:hypothetical protein